MKKFVFLLEEPSMEAVLTAILPKLFFDNFKFECIVHHGKSHLKKSIPYKIMAWRDPNIQFIIVHDQDSNDCKVLKDDLFSLVKNCNSDNTLIRIVCTELESWFLGDFDAIQKAYNIDLSSKKNKAMFRNPDGIRNAKQELRKLVPHYQEISGSANISKYIDIEKNK